MNRLLIITALVQLMIPVVAVAGIDVHATESGWPMVSGGRMQQESYGLTNTLVDVNNDLTGSMAPPILTDDTASVNGYSAVAAENQRYKIGYLLEGPNGVKFIYDRLVATPVLQLIGYEVQSGVTPQKETAPPPFTETPRVTHGVASTPERRDKPIPEPATLALTVAGLWLINPRRARRKAKARR